MVRTWFVTGSSRGLGRCIVCAALDSGDCVAATARSPSDLDDLVEKYGSDRIVPLPLDVTSYDQAEAAVQQAVRKFGSLDIVVNNAGFADCASIEDMPTDIFRAQIETNLFGVINVTKAVLPTLRKQASGHIIQISSVGGRLATPGLAAYQSAKWAVGGFSGVLSMETAPLGIKVTVVEPGGMKTDWAGSSSRYLPISKPYESTVGMWPQRQKYILENSSDPARMAQAVLQLTKVQDPPLRLLLGPETVPLAKGASEKMAVSDEKWKSLTLLDF